MSESKHERLEQLKDLLNFTDGGHWEQYCNGYRQSEIDGGNALVNLDQKLGIELQAARAEVESLRALMLGASGGAGSFAAKAIATEKLEKSLKDFKWQSSEWRLQSFRAGDALAAAEAQVSSQQQDIARYRSAIEEAIRWCEGGDVERAPEGMPNLSEILEDALAGSDG